MNTKRANAFKAFTLRIGLDLADQLRKARHKGEYKSQNSFVCDAIKEKCEGLEAKNSS